MGRVQGVRTPPPPDMTRCFLIQLVFCKKKTMWFIGVEVEEETSAPPPKKNPGSAPDMDMATHITKTCSAFFYLYNIRHMRKYLTSECTEKLIHAIITSRLDYCNSLLYGVADHHMQKLQRVMNASARFIFYAPNYGHITPLLQQLHWLPICLRIEFKILLITFKVLQGSFPKYLIDLISVSPPSRYDSRRNNKGILLSTLKRFAEVTMEDRSFMAKAPRPWNSLLVSIRSSCTKSF